MLVNAAEIREATNEESHVCGRAPSASPRGERVGERPVLGAAAVFCENIAGELFQHPA